MYKVLICTYLRNSGVDGGCAVHSVVVEFETEAKADHAILAVQKYKGSSYEWHKVIRLY